MNAPALDGVTKRADHVLLADDLIEAKRSMSAIKRGFRHGRSSLVSPGAAGPALLPRVSDSLWLRRLAPVAWIAGGGVALWLVFRHGFVNYDSFYSLVWGNEIFHGHSPDYSAPIPPTPHPLATVLGIVSAPFGDGAETITVALAFATLAAIGYLVYRLGSEWFNRPAGLLAAAIVLTREPVLSYGVRAYVDFPYIAFVLLALLIETRRPRAGWPVLVPLALAGLLRPEAWLFSAAYLVFLAYTRFRPSTLAYLGAAQRSKSGLVQVVAPSRRDQLRRFLYPLVHVLGRPGFWPLIAIAVSAPLLWFGFDLVVTGDPLYSLTGTQDTVDVLGRQTGLVDWIVYFPRRLGEILREPVLLGAALGGVMCLWRLRRRSSLGAAAGFVAAAAFALLAIAGLAVITRYALLAAVILAIFCGAGVFGWLELPHEDRWRPRWIAAASVVGVLLVAFSVVPIFGTSQYDRLAALQDSIAAQETIRGDLKSLADSGDFSGSCDAVTVPNHRPVPLLAMWLDRRPSEIVASVRIDPDGNLVRVPPPTSGFFIDPASAFVEENFTLDPNDPGELTAAVPRGFKPVARNDSWVLYGRCP